MNGLRFCYISDKIFELRLFVLTPQFLSIFVHLILSFLLSDTVKPAKMETNCVWDKFPFLQENLYSIVSAGSEFYFRLGQWYIIYLFHFHISYCILYTLQIMHLSTDRYIYSDNWNIFLIITFDKFWRHLV